MRPINLTLVILPLLLSGFASTVSAGGKTNTVADRGEALLHMGPHEVGYTSLTIADDTRGNRPINLMIWYPTGDDVSQKPIAVYQQVIPIPGLPLLPFVFNAENFSEFVEGRLVHTQVSVEAGEHPLFVHLPGGGAPGWLFPYEGVKYASHGFIFVSVTHVDTNICNLDLDAKLVLDRLLA